MKKTLRQRIVCIPMALGMAATSLFAVGCKKAELRTINEDDLSRWLVGFTCHYESDLENNYIEKTLKELCKRPRLDITMYYKDEYQEQARLNKKFNMLPTISLWYIDSNGERIENGELDGVKYYFYDPSYTAYDFEEDREVGPEDVPHIMHRITEPGSRTLTLRLWKYNSKTKEITGFAATTVDIIIKTRDTV